jgi:hypothetical protein
MKREGPGNSKRRLAPRGGVGFSIASEVFVPDDIRAFRAEAGQIARLRDTQQVARS